MLSMFLSMSTGIETLVSQNVGSGNIWLSGINLNQGLLVMRVLYCVISYVLLHTSYFMKYIGQDEHISELTEQYVTYYLPGLYLFGLCDVYRKFFNSFSMNAIPMVSLGIAVFLHPFWLYIFVFQYNMNLKGIALAGIITNALSYIIMRLIFQYM